LCVRELTQGLVQLGLLKGQVDALIANKAYGRFYLHSTGHWLGLDVHDVGTYKVAEQWRTLQPGMVFTVEPGIYIPAGMPDVDAKWWGIGIRIEDDIVVTEQGHEVLTAALPKTVAELETLAGSNG
jgi:Xaa-Pro aminopeptidase